MISKILHSLKISISTFLENAYIYIYICYIYIYKYNTNGHLTVAVTKSDC